MSISGLVICVGCSEGSHPAVQSDQPTVDATNQDRATSDGDSLTEETDVGSGNSVTTSDGDYPPFKPGLTPVVDPTSGQIKGPVLESTLPNIPPIILPEQATPVQVAPERAR